MAQNKPGGAQASARAKHASARASFRRRARQRLQLVATVAVGSLGQQLPTTQFPQVGLLSEIIIVPELTFTDTAASPSVTALLDGPFNALKRITGRLNLGTNLVFDADGKAFSLVQYAQTVGFDYIDLGAKSTGVSLTGKDPFFQYPTSSFVQNVGQSLGYCLRIPVSVNDGNEFSEGLINLQAPEVRFNLDMLVGQIGDIYTTADACTVTGNVYVYYKYYEVPNPGMVALPMRIMHRILQERLPILSTGPNTIYQMPREGILLQTFHVMRINGVIDPHIDGSVFTNLTLRVNKTDVVYNNDFVVMRTQAMERYGSANLPVGCYIQDYFNALMLPGRGDLRDAFDTEAISTLEYIYSIATGTSLGSNASFVDITRRILQTY